MGAFARSVAVGTAVAAVLPFLGFVLPMVMVVRPWAAALELASMAATAVAVPLAIVCAASVVFGIPTAFVLRRFEMESGRAYVVAGAALGCLIPLLPLAWFGAPSGHWTAGLGAASGAMTARTWWREHRRRQVR